MEKKKFELCAEVLRRLEAEGILERILLVGSWCMPVYEAYFEGKGVFPVLRTRDLEFLIPIPPRFEKKTDLKETAKAEKDRNQAVSLLQTLKEAGEMALVKNILGGMPKSWQSTIRKELDELGEADLLLP